MLGLQKQAMELQQVQNVLYHQVSRLHFPICTILERSRGVHKRSRCPIGAWVGPAQGRRARLRGRSCRASRRRWGRCRPRGPMHSYYLSINIFVPTSAHEVWGTKMTSDRKRPLHNTNSRHFLWHPQFHYLSQIISSAVIANFTYCTSLLSHR